MLPKKNQFAFFSLFFFPVYQKFSVAPLSTAGGQKLSHLRLQELTLVGTINQFQKKENLELNMGACQISQLEPDSSG